MTTGILIHTAVIALVSFLIWRRVDVMRGIYWPALILKLAAGISLGLVYKYYYVVGDTFSFFQDGIVLSRLARDDFYTYLRFLLVGDESFAVWNELLFSQPRSLFFTKIISFFSLITFESYWATALYFSFFSFITSWWLTTTLIRYWPNCKNAACVAFLFLPSVVFWTSGVIKEAIAFSCLCFLSALFLKKWNDQKITVGMGAFALWLLWVLWNLKYYYAAVFIPVIFTSYIIYRGVIPVFKVKRGWGQLTLWLALFIVLFLLVSLIHPNFHPGVVMEVIVANYEAFEKISHPEDMIRFYELAPTLVSFAINAPWALVSGLFRPFLWESGNMLQVVVACENLVLLIFFITAIPNLKRGLQSADRLLVLTLIIYVILLCIFITLSTPNFGTLSRYRAGYLPFFVMLILSGNPLIQYLEARLQRFTSRLAR